MGFGAQGPGAAGTGSSTQKKQLWYASWMTGDDTRGTDIEKDPSLNGYTFKLVKPDAMEKTSFISDIVAVGGATTFTFATGLHKGQFVNTSLQTVNGLLTIALMIWADYDLNELPWYAKIGITLGMALIANFEGRWFGAGDAWLYFFRLFYNVLGIAGGLPPTGIAARRGIRVNYADARCAAQSFTPSAAVSASGLSVGVLALSADAKLSVEVRADQSGAPASVVLAQAKIGVAEPRRPQWVMVSFAKPAVVPAKPHWIVLGAAKGAFVWLTEPDAGSVLTGAWGAGLWNALGSIDGARALYQIASADHPAGVQPAPLTAPDAWRLSLGSAVLAGATDKDNGVFFDLAASLTLYMQTATPVNGVTTAPIQVTAMANGGITVYAPRLVYDP